MAVCSVIIGYQRQIKVPMLSKEAIARIGNFLLTGKPFGFAQEMDESWADEEQWEDPNAPVEEQANYGSLSQEDFIRGEMILGLMGYDIENMTEEEEAKVLRERPDYLKLMPKFDVYGRWVHVIRETEVPEIEGTVGSMLGKDQEICVTDANLEEFWNFSAYRRFGLVLEGRCKILWNADMFSSLNAAGQLEAIEQIKPHIDKMTEGWLNLSEVQLVGLRVRQDKLLYSDFNDIKQVADKLGIPLDDAGGIEKQLIGVDVIDFEEAQAYYDIPVDFDSPEHLYEEPENGGNLRDYQEKYTREMFDAIKNGDLAEVERALYSGADPTAYSSNALRLAAQDGHLEIVNLLLQAGADPTADKSTAFRWAAVNNENEVVKVLLAAGSDPNSNYGEALSSASSENNLDLVLILLQAGADPNGGQSWALQTAARQGNLDIVTALLKAGGNPSTEKSYALTLALENNKVDIAKALIAAGAKTSDMDMYKMQKLKKLGLV